MPAKAPERAPSRFGPVTRRDPYMPAVLDTRWMTQTTLWRVRRRESNGVLYLL